MERKIIVSLEPVKNGTDFDVEVIGTSKIYTNRYESIEEAYSSARDRLSKQIRNIKIMWATAGAFLIAGSTSLYKGLGDDAELYTVAGTVLVMSSVYTVNQIKERGIPRRREMESEVLQLESVKP